MKRGEEISRPVEHTLSSTLVHRVFSPFMKQKSWKGGGSKKSREAGRGRKNTLQNRACMQKPVEEEEEGGECRMKEEI